MFPLIARRAVQVAALSLLLSFSGGPAAAPVSAQADPGCAFPQQDMAGIYVSTEHLMRVEIYPCGESFLQWDNNAGTHYAWYRSANRLPGGGVAAFGYQTSGAFLDGSVRIGYKPGSPGYVEVITLDSYDPSYYRLYRLRKVR